MNLLLSPILKWLLGGTLFLSLMLGGALFMEKRHSGKLQTQLTRCSEGRAADRAAYEAAQREAAEKNKATVERIEREQEKANAEVVSDLNSRLERLRSELRGKAGANQGAAGGTGLPQAPGGSGAPQAAGVCLEASEFLRAAENEERHDRLIDLIEKLIAQ